MNNILNKPRHTHPRTMVLEALEEYLFSIGEMLKYRKRDRNIWRDPNGGTLGYPSAILLFVIVDTIGSYFRGTQKLIQVDGKPRKISSQGYQHFFILNSEYFGLNLTEKDIKKFYNFARNKLIHNSKIGSEVELDLTNRLPFLKVNSMTGKGRYVVYLSSFHEACKKAVELFNKNETEIFNNSNIGKDFDDNH